MEQFRLDFDGINKAIKARALKMTPALFFAILLTLYISSVHSGRAIDAFPATVAICCVFFLTILIVYFGSQRFRRLLDSYTLTFEGNLITREQHNTPTITFTKADITEITRDKKGSYRIKAESWPSPIEIPVEIEDADRLYKLLSNIVPVIEKRSHDSVFKQIGSVLAVVAIILTSVLFETSKDRVVVLTAAVILAGLIIYSIIQNQRDKNIDYSTKGSLWHKALLLISIIIVIYKNLITYWY